jgi:hypothetical protein
MPLTTDVLEEKGRVLKRRKYDLFSEGKLILNAKDPGKLRYILQEDQLVKN